MTWRKTLHVQFHYTAEQIAAGQIGAHGLLAFILQYGMFGVQKDVRGAMRISERAIEAGDRNAMFDLGLLLEIRGDGVDVEADMARSVSLYRRAIDACHEGAVMYLAYIMENGEKDVQKDLHGSVELYERAIDAGDRTVIYFLGTLLEDGAEGLEADILRSVSLLRRAVDAEHVLAMVQLADILQHGNEDVRQDVHNAVGLHERAIEAGDVDAMFSMALLLENGAFGVIVPKGY